MDSPLSRVQADLQVMRNAIENPASANPDLPTPHLLLAASGALSLLLAWLLQLLGSQHFPLLAALAIGAPPFAAMIVWSLLKKRNPAFAPSPMNQARLWREFSWQMVGTGILVAVLLLCGFALLSAPVILTMIAVLLAALLQRPMMDHREFSFLGWCMAIALLVAAMLLHWSPPGPRGAVLGYVLILGGTLAALIAAWTSKSIAPRSAP